MFVETDRHWVQSSLVHDNRLCHTAGQTCPGKKQKRKLKRAGQTGTERSNGSPTVGLEIGHDGPATRVGRARRTVPRTTSLVVSPFHVAHRVSAMVIGWDSRHSRRSPLPWPTFPSWPVQPASVPLVFGKMSL